MKNNFKVLYRLVLMVQKISKEIFVSKKYGKYQEFYEKFNAPSENCVR